MKTFVIGDIHGAHLALRQCLERSGFDNEEDTLITLGDICDGWPYVYECVEELLAIKKRVDLKGNHDEWFNIWLKNRKHPDYWRQGGEGTRASYLRAMGEGKTFDPKNIPAAHWKFFQHQRYYYIDERRRLFVHAGYDHSFPIEATRVNFPLTLLWDRNMIEDAMRAEKAGARLVFDDNFSEVFIGHTAVNILRSKRNKRGIILEHSTDFSPLHAERVWNLDTGAGWNGVLTIMDVDTKEYWQSDNVLDLYPGQEGRRK